MKHFNDKVTVITGGASGLGRAMANRFAKAGMKLVIADIEEKSLEETVSFFESQGYTIIGKHCDVSKAEGC